METQKNKGGRPTDYREEYCQQAFKLCLLGATDDKLADFFEIAVSTLNNWKNKHPEFMEALIAGREEADARVADSLYNRAMGYSHPEDKIFNNNGDIVVAPTMKHYPPDTTACIFWLKNRQRDKWRDKVDQEITGKDGGPIRVESLSDEELEKKLSKLLPSFL